MPAKMIKKIQRTNTTKISKKMTKVVLNLYLLAKKTHVVIYKISKSHQKCSPESNKYKL